MKTHTVHPLLFLILMLFATLGIPPDTLAAPGDYLFTIGTPHILNSPTALAVDGSGSIFVLNPPDIGVQKIDSTGKFVTQWSLEGNTARGIAVDPAGNVYVADSGNSRIQKYDNTGKFLLQWGSTGSGNGQFSYGGPLALAVDSTGHVYAADTNNGRIQKFDAAGTYLGQWGSVGNGASQFNTLSSLTVDCSGNVYAADSFIKRIQKFNSNGEFLLQWGVAGTGNGQFSSLDGVAADCGGNVYASDATANRIQKFDSSGNYLAQWGGTGSTDGKFNAPKGLALDSNANLYVADTGNARIQKFSPAGTYLAQFRNSGEGLLNSVSSVAADGSGNIYLAEGTSIKKYAAADGSFLTSWENGGDARFVAADPCGNVYVVNSSKVNKYTGTGQFLGQWGFSYPNGYPILPALSPEGVAADNSCNNVYVVDYHNSQVMNFTSSGTFVKLWDRLDLQWPYGIAVDQAGFAYVANTYNDNIVKYDSSGNLVLRWGSTGSGEGQFNRPIGVAADAAGNIYVADNQNFRAQVFSDTGVFKGQWGTRGIGPGQFGNNVGLAVNPAGTQVFVADNTRVQVFSGFGSGYLLEYLAGPNGSISGVAKQAVLPGGSGSQVTAVGSSGYRFISWSDGVTTASRTDSNVNANLSVTANFSLIQSTYTLTFGAGTGGTVHGTSPQILWPGGWSSSMTAVANAGYHFVNWTGDNGFIATTENPLQLKNVQAAYNVMANFAADAPTYTLTFSADAGGTISGPTPQVVSAGSASVAVTALPNPGYRLVAWTYENGSWFPNPVVVPNVTANMNFVAHFSEIYTLTFQAGTGGTISGPSPQVFQFKGLTSEPVFAAANSGYHFVNWTGDNGFVATTANPLTVTNVQASQTISANFAADTPPSTYTLTFKAGTGGTVSGTSPQILWPGGWSSPVSATAKSGYQFVSWTGDNGFVTTTANPLVIKGATASQNITANFVSNQTTFTLTFKAGAGGSVVGTSPQILWPGGWSSAVSAAPSAGYHFVNWTGDNGFVTSTANPVIIKGATASQNLTANFARNR